MTLNKKSFRKTKVFHNFSLFSLFCHFFLLGLIYDKSHTTIFSVEKSASKLVLRGRKWLEDLDSIFAQVSIETLFVVFLYSFCNRKKK